MNIEELGKVAEMIGGLGDTAGSSFHMWIGLQVFESIWSSGVFIFVLYLAYKAFGPLVSALINEGVAVATIRQMRDYLGSGTSGPLITSEIKATLEAVKKLSEKS